MMTSTFPVFSRSISLFFLPAQAPKELKIFINLPRSMGFDDAERSEATQVLELSEEDYKDDGLIPLRYVKFQNVQSVTVRTMATLLKSCNDLGLRLFHC